MPVALITGASKGFGLAVASALAERGWSLVLDARGGAQLEQAAGRLGATLVTGDVADPGHRAELVAAVRVHGRLDLLLTSASTLGPGLQPLATYDLAELRRVFEVDVLAPLALVQELLALLEGGTVVNVSSDAAVEAYEGWGGYGSASPRSTSSPPCWRPSNRAYGCTPWTRVTCAPTCTSGPSRGRTSPTGPSRPPSYRRCCGYWTAVRPAAGTAPATC